MDPNKKPEAQAETSGSPCPLCGCPTYGDHTLDCPKHLNGVADLEKRLGELERVVMAQNLLLEKVCLQSAKLAGCVGDIGRVMVGEKPLHT